MTLYVPMFRWKRGERTGLEALSAATKSDVLPFIDISGDRFRGKKATKQKPATTAPVQFIEDAKRLGFQKLIVAAAKVAADKSGKHPIEDIVALGAASGIEIIPATELSAPSSYEAALRRIHAQTGQSICLKIDLQEMSSAPTWVSAWTFPLRSTHLLVDFADTVGTVSGLGTSIVHAFQHLHQATHWLSVTCAGTSMPENFSGFAAGTHEIPRQEWTLWGNLVSSGLSYDLQYGDYATVPITTPPSGIRWGYPINVRYTLEDSFLICRGVRTTGAGAVDADVQLVGHAKSIVSYPKRTPLAHCWADTIIDNIAAGSAPPKGLEHWVSLAVNRHVELVRYLLP
jgi:hypothetical protein